MTAACLSVRKSQTDTVKVYYRHIEKTEREKKKTKRKTTTRTTNKKAGAVFRLKLFFIFDLYIPIG